MGKKGWGDADKAHTKWLLSEAIRKEDEEDARKRTIKEKVRVEAKAYQKQLEEQMRRDDVEKEWQKKQAVWDREAAARASLQQEVLQTREVQIREKTWKEKWMSIGLHHKPVNGIQKLLQKKPSKI